MVRSGLFHHCNPSLRKELLCQLSEVQEESRRDLKLYLCELRSLLLTSQVQIRNEHERLRLHGLHLGHCLRWGWRGNDGHFSRWVLKVDLRAGSRTHEEGTIPPQEVKTSDQELRVSRECEEEDLDHQGDGCQLRRGGEVANGEGEADDRQVIWQVVYCGKSKDIHGCQSYMILLS